MKAWLLWFKNFRNCKVTPGLQPSNVLHNAVHKHWLWSIFTMNIYVPGMMQISHQEGPSVLLSQNYLSLASSQFS